MDMKHTARTGKNETRRDTMAARPRVSTHKVTIQKGDPGVGSPQFKTRTQKLHKQFQLVLVDTKKLQALVKPSKKGKLRSGDVVLATNGFQVVAWW
jgi:hypothetical protein